MNPLKPAAKPEMYTRRRLNALYREAGLKDNTFRMLRKYFCAMANLYGIIPLDEAFAIIHAQSPRLVTKEEFLAFAKVARHECENYYVLRPEEVEGREADGERGPDDSLGQEIIVRDVIDGDLAIYEELKKDQAGKPWYVPKKADLLAYGDAQYYEETPASDALVQFLIQGLALPLADAQKVFYEILLHVRSGDVNQQALLQRLSRLGLRFSKRGDMMQFMELCAAFHNNSRMQANRGYTPFEMAETMADKEAAGVTADQMRKDVLNVGFPARRDTGVPMPAPEAATHGKHKVGRNDPCPCGSGKKYKKCCGR